MTRIVLASRSVGVYVVALLTLSFVSWLLSDRAIAIDLSPTRPRNRLPYPELCGVVAAVVSTAVLRPRFWEWDRVGTARASAVSGVTAIIGIGTPALVIIAGSVTLSSEVSWAWTVSNGMLFAAIAFGIAPFTGVGTAAGVTLMLYFAVAVVHNLEPAVGSVLPITPHPGPTTHWVPVLLTATAAVVAQVATRGSTAWARRLSAGDRH